MSPNDSGKTAFWEPGGSNRDEAIVPLKDDARLRREVGLFRQRFQALTTLLQDLQGPRAPQTVLRSVQNLVAATIGADAVWLLDGRAAAPRPLMRSGEVFPSATQQEVKNCMRSGRTISLKVDESLVYLLPLQAGAMRWGVMVVRLPDRQAVDAETMRFLSLSASLIGGAGSLWESRTEKNSDGDQVYQGWLSLASLPSNVYAITGEEGTGKRTFAERMHERYVGGAFATVELDGSDDDEERMTTALKRPGLRSIYAFDAITASTASRAILLNAMETRKELYVFLGTSSPLWPIYPDNLLSRAGMVTIRLPALRERADEVPSMVQAGLSERGQKIRLSSTARQLLASHAWPGNYRELRRFIGHAEQALRLESGSSLPVHLVRHLLENEPWMALPDLVDQLESHVLAEAIRRHDGNRAAAARALGMTPRQVGYKCQKYGLE